MHKQKNFIFLCIQVIWVTLRVRLAVEFAFPIALSSSSLTHPSSSCRMRLNVLLLEYRFIPGNGASFCNADTRISDCISEEALICSFWIVWSCFLFYRLCALQCDGRIGWLEESEISHSFIVNRQMFRSFIYRRRVNSRLKKVILFLVLASSSGVMQGFFSQ